MITLHSNEVRVVSADTALREATVAWPDGRMRCVSMLALRGTRGGALEVARVCREAEKRAKAVEAGQIMRGALRNVALLALLAATLTVRADCLPSAPSATAFIPAAPPGGVIAQVLRVVVQWTDVRTERSYRVERSWWDGVAWRPWEALATLPRNATTWTDWQPAQTARYRVVAVNQCGERASGESIVAFP